MSQIFPGASTIFVLFKFALSLLLEHFASFFAIFIESLLKLSFRALSLSPKNAFTDNFLLIKLYAFPIITLTLYKNITLPVYCPYPGSVANGKILLVGNMGLYDYRPYVKKVTNNKQIMYDCDKGFVLADGPPGATCIGGNWSPQQLPK
jgi:hypothetical protein